MAKYKVYNYNRYPYGLRLMDGVREMAVPAHNGKIAGFVLLDEDEIYYLNSISPRTFRDGYLTTEPQLMENMGYSVEVQTVWSDDEIEALLKGNVNKIKTELKKLSGGKHITDRILHISKRLDLPMSKLKVIEEAIGVEFADIEE